MARNMSTADFASCEADMEFAQKLAGNLIVGQAGYGNTAPLAIATAYLLTFLQRHSSPEDGERLLSLLNVVLTDSGALWRVDKLKAS
jgi:hypothetical protein